MHFTDEGSTADDSATSDALSELSQVVTARQSRPVVRSQPRRSSNQSVWVVVYCVVIAVVSIVLIVLEVSGVLQQWLTTEIKGNSSTPDAAVQHAQESLSQAELLLAADRPRDALKLLRTLQYETRGNAELGAALDQQRLSRDLLATSVTEDTGQDQSKGPSKKQTDGSDVPVMFPNADWQHPVAGSDDSANAVTGAPRATNSVVKSSSKTAVAPLRAQANAMIQPKAAASDQAEAFAKAGWVAIGRHDVAAAEKLFNQSLKIAPANECAIVGAAVLPAVYGRPDLATADLEGLAAKKSGSSAAINLERLYLPTNPVRSARLLNDCLIANYGDREDLLNRMGTALWAADKRDLQSPMLASLASSYTHFDQQLADSRPGQKRWGTKWLAGSAADGRWSALRKVHDELSDRRDRVRQLEDDLVRLQQQYADAKGRTDFDLNNGKQHRVDLQSFEHAIADCQKHLSDARHDLATAASDWDKTEKPPFPGEMALFIP